MQDCDPWERGNKWGGPYIFLGILPVGISGPQYSEGTQPEQWPHWVEKKNIEELREAEVVGFRRENSREITPEICIGILLILLLNTSHEDTGKRTNVNVSAEAILIVCAKLEDIWVSTIQIGALNQHLRLSIQTQEGLCLSGKSILDPL